MYQPHTAENTRELCAESIKFAKSHTINSLTYKNGMWINVIGACDSVKPITHVPYKCMHDFI